MIIDEIRNGAPIIVPNLEENAAQEIIKQTKKIIDSPSLISVNVQNVADYYYSNPKNEWDAHKDFVNTVSPWKEALFEFNNPREINENGVIKRYNLESSKSAILVFSYQVKENNRLKEYNDEIAYMTLITHFIYNDGVVALIPCLCSVPLTKDGTIILDKNEDNHNRFRESKDIEKQLTSFFTNYSLMPIPGFIDKSLIEKYKYIYDVNPVIFLAINFAHCKNVTINENEIPDKIQKKRIKKNKVPLTKYYTLEIDPMRAAMKSVMNPKDGSKGAKFNNALHLCRGHFKDYREKGLFGSPNRKDIYWWDMHTRGSSKNGEIIKDYQVNSV